MKFSKILLSVLLLLIIAPVSTIHAEEAEVENEIEMLSIDVNINEIDVCNIVKEEILNECGIEGINKDASTIILDKVITNTLGDHVVQALVNVKTTNNDYLDTSISRLVNIHVVDIEAPVVVLSQTTVSVRTDQEFDINDYIEFISDNSFVEPSIMISDFDTSIEGVYDFEVTAVDESGNSTTEVITVHSSDLASLATYASDQILVALQYINEFRAENGLPPYTLGPENAQMAVGLRAYESIGDISHRRPDGSHYKTALDQFGVSYSSGPLEILTYAGSTPYDKVNWWKGSPGHRAILLASGYQYISIAYSGSMWCAIVY